jgi:hypothetical protein
MPAIPQSKELSKWSKDSLVSFSKKWQSLNKRLKCLQLLNVRPNVNRPRKGLLWSKKGKICMSFVARWKVEKDFRSKPGNST